MSHLASPCTPGAKSRLVADGLFVLTDGGICLYSQKADKNVPKLAFESIEKHPIILPDQGVIIDKIGNFTIAMKKLSSTSGGYLVLLVTKSMVGPEIITSVMSAVIDYVEFALTDNKDQDVGCRRKQAALEEALALQWTGSSEISADLFSRLPWTESPLTDTKLDPQFIKDCIRGDPTWQPDNYIHPASVQTDATDRAGTKEKSATKQAYQCVDAMPTKDIFETNESTSMIRQFLDMPTKGKAFLNEWTGRLLGSERPINQQDIKDQEPLFQQLRKVLVSLNVSSHTASSISDLVAIKCIGKMLNPWVGMRPVIANNAIDVIEMTLCGRKNIDIVQSCRDAKRSKKLMKLAFLGVNGVGKSTSVAKMAYQLKKEGMKVLLIACDTFRSGAVEQLKRHGERLGVDVYDQGYGKDSAMIAKYGIIKASQDDYDVAIIDTAGRMQGNNALMNELSRLININQPDLNIFVGEASVGNDGYDQLIKFKEALLHGSSDGRGIDCILLTKFDTVDQHVGVPLTLVHATGIPVALVGTGQQYQDLQALDVKKLAHLLISQY